MTGLSESMSITFRGAGSGVYGTLGTGCDGLGALGWAGLAGNVKMWKMLITYLLTKPGKCLPYFPSVCIVSTWSESQKL